MWLQPDFPMLSYSVPKQVSQTHTRQVEYNAKEPKNTICNTGKHVAQLVECTTETLAPPPSVPRVLSRIDKIHIHKNWHPPPGLTKSTSTKIDIHLQDWQNPHPQKLTSTPPPPSHTCWATKFMVIMYEQNKWWGKYYSFMVFNLTSHMCKY